MCERTVTCSFTKSEPNPTHVSVLCSEVIFYYTLQKDRSAFIQTTLLMVISSQLKRCFWRACKNRVFHHGIEVEIVLELHIIKKKSSAFLTTMSVLLSMSGKGCPFVSWSAFFWWKICPSCWWMDPDASLRPVAEPAGVYITSRHWF